MVAAGWLLRAWPVLHFGAWWRVPVDYDDAAYFVSSALFWQGEIPYRDFVYVHPPGFLLFLAPISMLSGVLGPSHAFSLARWAATLVGAANVALSARVAHRAAGPVAGMVAAVCYAVLPEAVLHERSTYLEPALNLACLLFADRWLTDRVARGPRSALAAGACLGFALAVKAWAAVWLAASFVSKPGAASESDRVHVSSAASAPAASPHGRRSLAWLVAGAAATALVVAAPFLVAAPGALLEQTVAFQLARPPDGMTPGLPRLLAMLQWSWPVAVLALASLPAILGRRGDLPRRSARLFATAGILAVLAFTFSPSYWPDYNAHLALALAHLAGLGAASVWSWSSSSRLPVRLAVAGLLIAVLALPVQRSWLEARIGGDLMERIGGRVRAIPPASCYFPFEPAWALAGDRLPSLAAGRSPVADVYGTMLVAAGEAGQRYPHVVEALHSRAAQRRIRALLAGCEFLSLGDRGELQLTPRTRRWIAARWEDVSPRDSTGFDLWRRRQRDARPD